MKEKLVNAALLMTSFIFCSLALEVGLRAYHSEWGYINFRDPQGAWLKAGNPFAFDIELGWVPNQGVWSGGDLTILSDGIRSNERPNPRGRRFLHLRLGGGLGNLAGTAGRALGKESDECWGSRVWH